MPFKIPALMLMGFVFGGVVYWLLARKSVLSEAAATNADEDAMAGTLARP